MGTSFRSSLSWGIPVTAVELIPSVPALFGYYHADAAGVLARPGARIVVDDGRRFLERTGDRFDIITVDPPPPVEAAGSSLLYSEEFFAAARARLAPGGIMQQWLPTAEPIVVRSVARAMTAASFPTCGSSCPRKAGGFTSSRATVRSRPRMPRPSPRASPPAPRPTWSSGSPGPLPRTTSRRSCARNCPLPAARPRAEQPPAPGRPPRERVLLPAPVAGAATRLRAIAAAPRRARRRPARRRDLAGEVLPYDCRGRVGDDSSFGRTGQPSRNRTP